ncbi:hypothetical protein HanXRQr2_Chr10g0440381 [Helianthus annuus]|uniref:Uncharacterized protein n=1 Tax=Helianthus annuus TaxID=4232 RepID=A0A251TIT1_HELAN|nr:hypothetical protein HanXRQr2_Chr10g0440381 [Helianthus annuus]KAJ0521742.1 hypothetical protein HanIR_Chr10g0474551 [Helianthus annuus]
MFWDSLVRVIFSFVSGYNSGVMASVLFPERVSFHGFKFCLDVRVGYESTQFRLSQDRSKQVNKS